MKTDALNNTIITAETMFHLHNLADKHDFKVVGTLYVDRRTGELNIYDAEDNEAFGAELLLNKRTAFIYNHSDVNLFVFRHLNHEDVLSDACGLINECLSKIQNT